jgi:hypothetical protein
MLGLAFQNFDGKSAKQDNEMCPLRFEYVPDVVPNLLALGNREFSFAVMESLAVLFDVVGVSVPHLHARCRELCEHSTRYKGATFVSASEAPKVSSTQNLMTEKTVGLILRVVGISSIYRIPVARARNYKSNLTDHLLRAFVTRRARLYVSIWQPTLS